MLPRRLRIRNIGPYQDQSIDLASIPDGLVAITGLNGQGKTMFMESMFAGAYRDFPTRPDGIYGYCTERNAGIELEFEMDGKVYRSIINIDSKARKMESVLALDGLPLNDGKTGSFDEQIRKILGSREQILASSYGAQDKNGNFTSLSKAKRKDLFIQMIGLQLLQGISEYAAKKGLGLEPSKTRLAGQIEVLQATAAKEIPDIDAIRAALEFKRGDYAGIQETLNDMSKHLVLEGAKYDRLPKLQDNLAYELSKLREFSGAAEALTNKLRAAESVLSLAPDEEELGRTKNELASQREKLIILRQKTEALPALKAKRDTLALAHGKHTADLQRIMLQVRGQETLAESLASLREKSGELDRIRIEHKEASTQLRMLNSEMVRLSQEETERSTAILKMQNKISAAVMEEKTAQTRLADAQERAKSLKEVPCGGVGEYATCPLIKSAVEGSSKIDELSAKLDNLKILLLTLRQETDALPRPDDSGKAEAAKRSVLLTQKVNETSDAIKALEAAVAKLPEAEAASNQIVVLRESEASARAALAAAKSERDIYESEIAKIESLGTECVSVEGAILELDGKLGRLEAGLKQAQQAETLIPSYTEDLRRIAAERAALEATSGEIAGEIEALKAAKGQYEADKALWNKTKNETMPALQDDIDSLSAQVSTAENEKASILSAQVKVKEAEGSLNEIVYQMACCARVAKSFGPMEIQSFEIDNSGPEVSRLSNELLFNCFGPRFSIRFVTQELKIDGKGYKDEFDVSVDDQKTGRTVSISDLSGGEKTIVSEALALGIALYNKEKSGVSWGTLFRDEVSGALDDVYAPQYIAMLRAAREMGHFRKVYFICHQPRLQQMADSRVQIHQGTAAIIP